MPDTTLFQYCQKLIILSADKKSVLLAKRKGEADYNGTFTFVGGKLEVTDASIVSGMKREKDEEVGPGVKVKILPNETYNILFRKKDGNSMILPHVACQYMSGDIELSDEYSEYKWVPIEDLEGFGPKIENIPELTNWAVNKLSVPNQSLVEI